MAVGTQCRHAAGCRNPIQCIVPPHMFDRIARNGTDEQRDWALETLSRDHSLRAARLQNVLAGLEPAIRADALAASTPGHPKRTIYDVKGTETLPGTVVRAEGGPSGGDDAANEAYDGLGDTYTFYWEVFHRDSLDDAGLPLDGVVHYGQKYDNAFWDGHRMIFGDGDGVLFNRFTISLDVIGHELTHGVTQHTLALNYWQEPGALNESISDVFGSLVKQYTNKQSTADADWLIGAGLLAPGVQGRALRDMKNPGTAYDDKVLGKDPQPATMADFVQTVADNGGVHTNSGIPNRAFYLVADKIGGNAWEKPGSIWYATIRDPQVKPTARFAEFARATQRAARRIFGNSSNEAKAVTEAWQEVGVDVPAVPPGEPGQG